MPQIFSPRQPAERDMHEDGGVHAHAPPEFRSFAPVDLPPGAHASLTFPFVSRARREMSVRLTVQPIFNLTEGRMVSRRVRRVVRHHGGESALRGLGRSMLETADLRRIDLGTLQHGLALLPPEDGDSGVIPAFWRTVSTSHGRFALVYAGLQQDGAPARVMIEVVGVPECPDIDAVAEAIAHFETERQGVILHIPPDPALAERLAGAGCGCLAMDFAGVDYARARGWQEAERLIRAARSAAPGVLILNIAPHWGAAAAAAGATHAVFCAMPGMTV